MVFIDEFEVIPARHPVAGTDVQVALHTRRAYANALAASRGGTAAQWSI
jgi:hypothetical protein